MGAQHADEVFVVGALRMLAAAVAQRRAAPRRFPLTGRDRGENRGAANAWWCGVED